MNYYALRENELREVRRLRPQSAGAPMVVWCPFCDTSTQDARDCRCGAIYLSQVEAERMVAPPEVVPQPPSRPRGRPKKR